MNNRHPPPQQKSCWDEGRNKRGRRGPQTPACDSLQQRSFAKLGRTTTPRSVRLAHLSLSFLSRWGPAFRPNVPIKTTEGKKKHRKKKNAKRRTDSLTGRISRELTELWLFPRRPRERTSGGGLPRGPALSERGRALAGISPFLGFRPHGLAGSGRDRQGGSLGLKVWAGTTCTKPGAPRGAGHRLPSPFGRPARIAALCGPGGACPRPGEVGFAPGPTDPRLQSARQLAVPDTAGKLAQCGLVT